MKSDQAALPFNMFDFVISGRIRCRIWRICWKDTWPKGEMAERMGKKHVRGKTRFFFWGTIEEPLGPNYVFWYLPREIKRTLLKSLVRFWNHPPSPQQAVAFWRETGWGNKFLILAAALWQPLWGYISSGKPSRLLWTSFYGQHLRGWFSSWNASQFLVLPYKLMSTKPVAVCKCFGGWTGGKCRNFHHRGKRI